MRGFTLLELCAVVGIVAILSSLATNNYSAYVLRARAAEAVVNVETLGYLEQAHILDTGAPLACEATPAAIPAPDAPAFFTGTSCWRDLGFRPTARVRFQYRTEISEGRRFVVTARGDLDGDGTPSVYTVDSRTMTVARENAD